MKQSESEPTLSLFFNDSEESKQARNAIEEKGEKCHFYNIDLLSIPPGEKMIIPTLYAPEGIFQGWRQIKLFLRIPSNMRYHSLLQKQDAK